MSEATVVKPCPFCGGPAVIGEWPGGVYVDHKAPECPLDTKSLAFTLEKWNHRYRCWPTSHEHE